MAINKVEFGGRTLIDLTNTTATADKILTGYGAYGKDGVWVDGTAIESSPDGAVYQDSEGYVVLDDGPGTHVEIESLNVTENGTYTAPTGYAYSPVSVDVEPNVESLSITPTEEQQVFDGAKYTEYYTQTFSNYIGGGTSNIDYNESMVVGNKYKVHVRLYYLDNTYYPTTTIDEKDADITLSESEAASVILFDKTTQRVIYFYPTFARIPSFGSTSYEEIHFEVTFYNPSESLDGYLPVTVNAISSTYVGSGITKRSSADLTASGPTVTVPAGYYSAATNKSVASGSTGTPTATKGVVSNNSVSVTTSVTNTTGFITGGTKTGIGVTVSASELVSGTYTVSSSGTKDVTNYASVSVPAGSVSSPTATKGTVSNNSITVTPSVDFSEGYISGGTKNGTGVTVSASELVSGNLSVTENGTGINVTNYATVSVDVEQGDMLPHFYVHYASDYSTITSTTCDMTYSEIVTLIGGRTEYSALVYEWFPDEVNPDEGSYSTPKGATCRYDSTNNNIIIYATDAFGGPLYIITYTSDGALSTVITGHKYSSDLIVNGATVTAPSGYYPFNASKSVASATQATPAMAFASTTGLVTATATQTSGYVSAGTKSSTYQLPVKAAATYTPTETTQTIGSYQWLTGTQTIAAISSTYVGTGVTQRSAADMTVSGSYVTAPSGYYSEAFSRAVSAGSITFNNSLVSFDILSQNISLFSSTGLLTMSGQAATQRSPSAFSSGYFSSVPSYWVGANVYGSYSLPVLAATTYTPGTSNQTISRYQWLTGSQTILGDANLVSDNIKSGVSIFGVVGTMEGGGGSGTTLSSLTVDLKTYKQMYYGGVGSNMINSLDSTGRLSINTWYLFTSVNYLDLGKAYHISAHFYDADKPVQEDFDFLLDSDDKDNPTEVGGRYRLTTSGICLLNTPAAYGSTLIQIYDTGNVAYRPVITNQIGYPYDLYSLAFYNSAISLNSYPSGTVAAGTFMYNHSLTYVSLPMVNTISSYGFYYCDKLSSLNIGGSWGYIGAYAFAYCSALPRIDFNNCNLMGYAAFASCYSLAYAYIRGTSSFTMGGYAFYRCSSLQYISASRCTSIGGFAFGYCSKLTSIEFKSCRSIGSSAFYECDNLKTVSIPVCTTIGERAFYGCNQLNSISFPEVTTIMSYAFISCFSLQSVVLPKCTILSSGVFQVCSALSYVQLDVCSTIGDAEFWNSHSLMTLRLLSTSVVTLISAASRVFNGTPILNSSYTGEFGSIYVPSELLSDYKNATNWVAVSDRITTL